MSTELQEAYHEAGHAIAALALRLDLAEVHLAEGCGQHGACRLRVHQLQPWHLQTRPDVVERLVRTSVAGGVAEAIRRGEDDNREAWRLCSRSDRRLARAYARPMHGRRVRAFIRGEIGMTRHLLLERWSAVEDLACSLLLNRRLTSPEVKVLLEHAARR